MKSTDFALPGVTVSRHEAAYRSAKFDLSLECQEREGALECAFEFCTTSWPGPRWRTSPGLSSAPRALGGARGAGVQRGSCRGRLDRSRSTTAPLTPSDPPTSRTELALLELWRELLGAHRTFAADDASSTSVVTPSPRCSWWVASTARST